MKKAIRIIVVFSLLFFVGCASSNSSSSESTMMNSWMGATKSQLLSVWGPPDRVTSDGQDGEILVYDKTASMNGLVLTRSRCFYFNKEGKIYYWLCKGRQGY